MAELVLHLDGYKSFLDTDIALTQSTVLVGPNGCGKTSVLEAFRHLGSVMRGLDRAAETKRIENVVAGLRPVDWSAVKNPARPTATIELRGGDQGVAVEGGGPGRFEVAWRGVIPTGSKDLRLAYDRDRAEALQLWAEGDGGITRVEPDHALLALWTNAPRFHVVDLTLSASALGAPSRPAPATQDMGNGYAGLASVLANRLTQEPDEILALIEDLNALHIPVRKLRTRSVELEAVETENLTIDGQLVPRTVRRPSIHHVLDAEMAGGARVLGPQLSAGTLTAIATLLAVKQLHASSKVPTYVLIDELGGDLHPRAQHGLVELLRKTAALELNLRFIVTTHSPFVVDAFALDEVRIMSLDDAGITRVAKLDEHTQWPKWKDTMLPGEFWTWAGESWVKNG